MNKTKLLIALGLLVTTLSTGCSSKKSAVVLDDYIIEVNTYKKLDYDFALSKLNEIYDSHRNKTTDSESSGKTGCSSVVKFINGENIVGRNYDLPISNNPTYIVKTKVNNEYSTVGLSYNPYIGQTFNDIKENGLGEEYQKILPFMCHDILNSQGLYVELNMRNGEPELDENYEVINDVDYCYNSNVAATTNSKSDTRICALHLPRYLAQKCADVNEAVNLVKELDIYTDYSAGKAWNYGILIADAKGNYGVFEVARNQVKYVARQNMSFNYFTVSNWFDEERYQSGLGRRDYALSKYDSIKSEEDMFNLMNDITFSQVYDLENCKFDSISEFVQNKYTWTNDYVNSHKEEVLNALKPFVEYYQQLYSGQIKDLNGKSGREAIRDVNYYWESVFTNVTNCKQKVINVRYFEDDTKIVKLGFKGDKPVVLENNLEISK